MGHAGPRSMGIFIYFCCYASRRAAMRAATAERGEKATALMIIIFILYFRFLYRSRALRYDSPATCFISRGAIISKSKIYCQAVTHFQRLYTPAFHYIYVSTDEAFFWFFTGLTTFPGHSPTTHWSNASRLIAFHYLILAEYVPHAATGHIAFSIFAAAGLAMFEDMPRDIYFLASPPHFDVGDYFLSVFCALIAFHFSLRRYFREYFDIILECLLDILSPHKKFLATTGKYWSRRSDDGFLYFIGLSCTPSASFLIPSS